MTKYFKARVFQIIPSVSQIAQIYKIIDKELKLVLNEGYEEDQQFTVHILNSRRLYYFDQSFYRVQAISWSVEALKSEIKRVPEAGFQLWKK